MDTMAKFGNAHFDATWKCMYSGHPLFIPCFTDTNGKTWEAGIVLASHEKAITFEYQMSAVKYLPKFNGPFSVIERCTLPSGETNERLAFIPQDLMADGADAITNAKDKVFPATRRAMCYPHVEHAWKKKAMQLGIMPGTELYKKLEEEI